MRSKVACSTCRKRKVRCNLMTRGEIQCTNCYLDSLPCNLISVIGIAQQKQSKRCEAQETANKILTPIDPGVKDVKGLEDKSSLALPCEPLFNEILARFFDYVYPQLPFIDVKQISGNLRQKALSGEFSFFILYAMIAAAWPHLDEASVTAAGSASARQGSEHYIQRATRLVDIEYETNTMNLIQGFLFLSMCARNDPSASMSDSVQFLNEAIYKARTAYMHKEGTDFIELPLDEKRLRRRLWWCCYVQDRMLNLLAGRKPLIWDKEMEVSPLSFEDFDSHNMVFRSAQKDPTVLRDTFGQVLHVYLFKLTVELCQFISCSPSGNTTTVDKIGENMDRWYQSMTESVSAQAFSKSTFECLVAHWESLVLLYHTARLLSKRTQWAEEHPRMHQGQLNEGIQRQSGWKPAYAFSELQHLLRNHATIVLQLQNRGQLRHILLGGLWAILPAMMTIVQVIGSKEDSVDTRTYREIYFQHLSILDSQSPFLEAVGNIVPFMKNLLSKESEAHHINGTYVPDQCDPLVPMASCTATIDQFSAATEQRAPFSSFPADLGLPSSTSGLSNLTFEEGKGHLWIGEGTRSQQVVRYS